MVVTCAVCEEPILPCERSLVCPVCGNEVHDECTTAVNGVKVCKECAKRLGEDLPVWA